MPASELAASTKPLCWLADELLIVGGAAILGGPPKSGKSYFALELCVAIASGTPCAARFKVPTPGRVTLFCAEDPPAVVVNRLTSLARSRGFTLDQLPIDVIVEPDGVRLPEGLARLAATIAKSPHSLVLLDPLIRLHRADENSAAEMSVILDGIRALARASTTAVLLVHHTRKAPAGASPGASFRGSSDLSAFGDTNLYFKKLGSDGAVELRIEHRASACPPPARFRLVIDEAALPLSRFVPIHDERADNPLAPRIRAALQGATGPISSRALRDILGVRNQAVADSLRTLLAEGRVRRVGRDGWTCRAEASTP